jgi:anti-sigma factor RsiW
MSHPMPGELLELHFGEVDERRREPIAAHLGGCAQCRALLADVEWAERALSGGPGEEPPADGLERVLARIERMPPARRRASPGIRAGLPSMAALLAGAVAIHQGGLGAALAFFAVGSLLTLSLAPVLILESQRRS